MKITALTRTSPERITVCFDDGTELKSTLSVVTELRLRVGEELDEVAYEELSDASSLSLCKAHALRLINMRAMSRREMIRKLTEKGETPENAEACADRLCELGLIDDSSYACAVVRHYSAKGYGASRIRQELAARGIDRELALEVLSEMPEQDEFLERFLRSRLTDPSDKAQVKKVSDALFRRGYSWDQIRHALYIFNSQEDHT